MFRLPATLLTRSFHKRKHVATATLRQSGFLTMKRASQLVLAGLIASFLGACATPQPDYTPPPAKRADAKTTLENRR